MAQKDIQYVESITVNRSDSYMMLITIYRVVEASEIFN